MQREQCLMMAPSFFAVAMDRVFEHAQQCNRNGAQLVIRPH